MAERRMTARTRRRLRPRRRFEVGLVLLGGVLAFGTAGYVVVGLSPFDALYQTAITISTVGYGEIGPTAELDRAYRSFTLLLVLVGATSAIYTASALLETLVEGALDHGFRRRRMQRQVDKLRDHTIIAGWGRVGRAIGGYARRHGTSIVVIEQDPALVDDDSVLVVTGDATDDDTLAAAGIDRAASLIAALGSDSDNLALTLTAHSMRTDLLIVARVSNRRDERKFLRAGAERVVNPYEIGGSRMASIALRPHVAEFLDEVIHADDHDVDIYEVRVEPGSTADGATLEDLLTSDESAAVIAVRSTDGRFVPNPPRARQLQPGEVLIAVGSAERAALLEAAATAEPTSRT